jgi:Ribbon-helix-helix protein
VQWIIIRFHPTVVRGTALTLEDRTARLTILIDPRKKAVFERLCAEEDSTPSQVVRRLIRGYIEERTGQPWIPAKETGKRVPAVSARRAARSVNARAASPKAK